MGPWRLSMHEGNSVWLRLVAAAAVAVCAKDQMRGLTSRPAVVPACTKPSLASQACGPPPAPGCCSGPATTLRRQLRALSISWSRAARLSAARDIRWALETSFPGALGPSGAVGMRSRPLSRGWKEGFSSQSGGSASRGSKSSKSLSSRSFSSLPTGSAQERKNSQRREREPVG